MCRGTQAIAEEARPAQATHKENVDPQHETKPAEAKPAETQPFEPQSACAEVVPFEEQCACAEVVPYEPQYACAEIVPFEPQCACAEVVPFEEQCACAEVPGVRRWSDLVDEDQTQDVKRWSELDVSDEDQLQEVKQDELVTTERKQPLPVRALRSRLRNNSSRPTWAAWLPSSVQQAEFQCAPYVAEESTMIACCDDMAQMMPGDMGYAYPNMPFVECYDPNTIYQPMMTMDGVNFEPVVFETDNGESSFAYYTGAELDMGAMGAELQFSQVLPEQGYMQLDQLPQQDLSPAGPLTGNIWKLSKDARGCRQVQQAFDDAATDEERMTLTEELRGHVWEALKCAHANHVMQKCISTIRPQEAQFVIDELTHRGPGGVVQAARHRFGCRIIERVLEHCSEEQVASMVEDLLGDAVQLSLHVYGNYVMQHLLEHCRPDVVSRLTVTLEQNVGTMAPDGYVGSVLAKALMPTNQEANGLASALLTDMDRVAIMACSRWGHLAVKQALQLTDVVARRRACGDLLRRSDKLRSSRYGRLVASFATEQQRVQGAGAK